MRDDAAVLADLSSHAALVARATQFRMLEERPVDRPRVTVLGADPIRVLILGAGLAAGYGVSRHRQTLAGTLATRLADASHRGVIVDIRATSVLRAHAAVDFISPVGAHTYHAAIFASSHLESAFRPGTETARHAQSVQDHLLSTGSPTMQLVILGVPKPSGSSRTDRLALQAAVRANRALNRSAATHSRVSFIDAPGYSGTHTPHPFTARYYDVLGNVVADALVPTFTTPHQRPDTVASPAATFSPQNIPRISIALDPSDISYSTHIETPREVLANRFKVTSSLFATAIGMSLLLGRRR